MTIYLPGLRMLLLFNREKLNRLPNLAPMNSPDVVIKTMLKLETSKRLEGSFWR